MTNVNDVSNPHQWRAFLCPSLFSLGVAAGTAVISAGLYLGLPPSVGFAAAGIGGSLLILPLILTYRAWGWGSWRAEVALWATGLLSVLGTIVFEVGLCCIVPGMILSGSNGVTYVQCSTDYLRGGRFAHALFGFFFTFTIWVGLRYHNAQRRRNQG